LFGIHVHECIVLLQFDVRDFACCWNAPVRATQVCTTNADRLLKLLLFELCLL